MPSLRSQASKVSEIDHPWTLHRKQIAFDVQWRFETGPGIRPWASLGMGFGSVDLAYDYLTFRSSAHAVDFARLGAGVDFLAGRYFAMGPFVRGSLGHTRLTSADDLPGAQTESQGDTGRFVEQSRQTQKVRVTNPDDDSIYVDVMVITSLTMKDTKTNELWVWTR